MTLRWPDNLAPHSIDAHLEPRPVGGTPALSGGRQWVQSDAGCWSIQYEAIPVTGDGILMYRALSAQLNGPATPILVPVFEGLRAPWASSDHDGETLHDDDTEFSDDTGYDQPVIDVTAAAAVLRATALTVTLNLSATLSAGMFFSLGERLYLIAALDSQIDAGPPEVWRISIMPPLREAISDGTSLNFETPACRCVLAQSGGMPLSLDLVRGEPSVTFTEDFSG